MRKTFNVESLVLTVNHMLAFSTCSTDMRHGMINVLEGVLHDAGAYTGYRYLYDDEVPAGHLPGVNREKDATGNMIRCTDYDERFTNTDSTRRQY